MKTTEELQEDFNRLMKEAGESSDRLDEIEEQINKLVEEFNEKVKNAKK